MCELLSQLNAPAYIARVTCADPANALKAKAAVKRLLNINSMEKAFLLWNSYQTVHKLGNDPAKSLEHIKNVTSSEFPLGEFRAK